MHVTGRVETRGSACGWPCRRLGGCELGEGGEECDGGATSDGRRTWGRGEPRRLRRLAARRPQLLHGEGSCQGRWKGRCLDRLGGGWGVGTGGARVMLVRRSGADGGALRCGSS